MLSSLLFTILTFGAVNTHKVPTFLQNPTTCLAENIYFEARNQSIVGQIAVSYVTLNRVANSAFPSTVCGVVHEGIHTKNGSNHKCQFSWYCDGKAHNINEPRAWMTAYLVAEMTLITYNPYYDPTHGALFYHKIGCPKSRHTRTLVTIGEHSFYNIKQPASLAGVWDY